MENNARLIKALELTERFDLNKYFSSLIPKGASFIVCEGDVNLKGNLSLDGDIGEWEKSDEYKDWCKQLNLDFETGKKVAGIIVDGNLNIDGSLWNFDDEFGVLFLITGGLTAKNVCAGGAVGYILGNAKIDECVYSDYNSGTLRFLGDLTTKVYVNDQHDTVVKGKLDAPYCACSMGYVKNAGGLKFDSSSGELVISKDAKEFFSFEALENGVGAALYCNGTALRKESDKPPELTEDDWLKKIEKNYKLISKLPPQFRTEDFFCRLADTATDRHRLKELGFFPKDMLTDKVCGRLEQACITAYKEECEDRDIAPDCVLHCMPEWLRTPRVLEVYLQKPFEGNTYNYQYFAYIPDASLMKYLPLVKDKTMDVKPLGGYYYLHVVDYEVDNAKLLAWQGDYDAALVHIEKAKKLAKDIVKISPRKDMGELADYGDYRPVYYEGYIRYMQGDTAEAKRLLALSKRLCTLFYRAPTDYGNKAELIAYKDRINPYDSAVRNYLLKNYIKK